MAGSCPGMIEVIIGATRLSLLCTSKSWLLTFIRRAPKWLDPELSMPLPQKKSCGAASTKSRASPLGPWLAVLRSTALALACVWNCIFTVQQSMLRTFGRDYNGNCSIVIHKILFKWPKCELKKWEKKGQSITQSTHPKVIMDKSSCSLTIQKNCRIITCFLW